MEREQAQAEQLVLVHEMPDVGAAEPRARRAVAVRVDRLRVAREPRVAEIEAALRRERAAGAGRPRRQDAVEHVDPRLDDLEDPFRVADPHEVARLLGRHQRRCPVRHLEHRSAVLADRQAADRVAVEVELGDLLGRAAPELRVDAALGDAEAQLAVRARRMPLPRRPLRRPAHRLGKLARGDVGRGNLVEAHRDVAAEVCLDLRGELRREARLAPVVHVAERDAVVVDARDRVAQREHLEAAGVGEDRLRPSP